MEHHDSEAHDDEAMPLQTSLLLLPPLPPMTTAMMTMTQTRTHAWTAHLAPLDVPLLRGTEGRRCASRVVMSSACATPFQTAMTLKRERETEDTQDSVESENGVHLGDPLNEIVVCECMCVMKASQIVVSHAMITIQKMNKSAVHRETHN